ncbi:hypothetical protein ACYSNX_06895 [Myroides sp. LJL115]
MIYPFISVGLLVAFIVYLIYVIGVKKDFKRQKNNVFAGLFIVLIWGVIYYFLTK